MESVEFVRGGVGGAKDEGMGRLKAAPTMVPPPAPALAVVVRPVKRLVERDICLS